MPQVFKLLLKAIFVLGISSSAFAQKINLTIYHTNDLHSHVDGFQVSSEAGLAKRGGFDRLTSMIQELRKQAKQNDEIIFGVDAGDFFAGTVFSALGPSELSEFPEYDFFVENGFELTTLGNHEFDAWNLGLERMLQKASTRSITVPVVSTNIKVKEGSPLNNYIGSDKIIRPYLVKEYSSQGEVLKVGFIGILGPNGCMVSRATRQDVGFVGCDDERSKADWKPLFNLLQSTIDKLRTVENVDMVVLSMHGGSSEAQYVAEKLKNLDVLIAGHTHRVEFEKIGNTWLTQTGSYGANLGVLQFQYDKKTKTLSMREQHLPVHQVVDSSGGVDSKWSTRIGKWKQQSLQIMNIDSKSPSAKALFIPQQTYPHVRDINNPMGSFVTTALANELNSQHQANVDFYFTSAGLIRDSFRKDVPYNESDIFNIFSVGFDEQLKPGVPTVAFYITPEEAVRLINFLEIYSKLSGSFSPVTSEQISYRVRSWGIPFLNRIADLKIKNQPIGEVKKLIKVGTNQFVAKNIDTVTKISYGLVSIEPKNASGERISVKDFEVYPKEYELMVNYLRKQQLK